MVIGLLVITRLTVGLSLFMGGWVGWLCCLVILSQMVINWIMGGGVEWLCCCGYSISNWLPTRLCCFGYSISNGLSTGVILQLMSVRVIACAALCCALSKRKSCIKKERD